MCSTALPLWQRKNHPSTRQLVLSRSVWCWVSWQSWLQRWSTLALASTHSRLPKSTWMKLTLRCCSLPNNFAPSLCCMLCSSILSQWCFDLVTLYYPRYDDFRHGLHSDNRLDYTNLLGTAKGAYIITEWSLLNGGSDDPVCHNSSWQMSYWWFYDLWYIAPSLGSARSTGTKHNNQLERPIMYTIYI